MLWPVKMATNLKELFVVAISSSALFDTKEGSDIYDAQGLEAFIDYQIKNEDTPFKAGPAMPVINALIAANKALTRMPRIEVMIMSHNNPAAAIRTMKSIETHNLTIKRASFVGDAPLDRYLKAHSVSLFLSRNLSDVRAALDQGVAAARLMDSPEHVDVEDGQLRIAFDGDAVLFSDDSERVFKTQGVSAFQEYEKAREKIPLTPGPFAPVLHWIAQIQREAADSGSKFSVRTAIVTARNEVAMSRVIRTMRAWNVRVDEVFFLGDVPKPKILQAFRPHIYFDDQEGHILPASKFVPSAHVPYGIANETNLQAAESEAVATTRSTQEQSLIVTAAKELEGVTSITKRDFETRCRAIFKSYTALSPNGKALDERYRVFIAKNADRDGIERAKILRGLKRYDLSDLASHDPMLNRELGDIVRDKLNQIVADALAPIQQDFNLE